MPRTKKAGGSRAVFLDRDGTIIREAHYLTDPAGVKLYNGAGLALRRLKKRGFKLVIVSNQSGIGRGWVSLDVVHEINKTMSRLLHRTGAVRLDGVYFCPHAPWQRCSCRKPKTMLIQRARRELNLNPRRSYMIGDKAVDMELANRSGMTGVFVLTGHGRGERPSLGRHQAARPAHIARDLASAARWIIRREAAR
ncbi:MAG: HAD family hydrolase [Elusimicrobia bacterium]|nr:HAD family hydrolase [Elusimicrobiota bacterium]